jgi:hypothetical protein
MHLPVDKQRLLIKLLKQKPNVDRFMYRRSQQGLAYELGVVQATIVHAEHCHMSRSKLTPDEIEYVKRMRFEYKKHKAEALRDWTLKGIARVVGVGERTADRWNQKLLDGEIR